MKSAILGCIVAVTCLVVSLPAASAAPAIQLRSENGAGQHHSAQPIELVTEHSAGQHVTQGRAVAVPVVVAAPSEPSSFSWRDAGVGAGAAAVGLLLVFAAFLALQRRGKPAAT